MLGHDQLTELAIVALAALVCGMAFARLKQPAIVGYILAGVILGPSGLGLVENREGVGMLAELGVLMLLFVVGMELSLTSFKTVWKVAVVATGAQIAIALAAMWLMGLVLGWPAELSILLGFALALSSTAVVVKMLDEIGESKSQTGATVIGILIAQDLAVVPMIITIDAMGGEPMSPFRLVVLVIAAAALVGIIVFLSRRRVYLPFTRVIQGSSDLTPLAGLVVCFVAASITGLIGLSPAYGAFLAGVVLGNSSVRRLMIRQTEPIQSVLMMVFFLSIGLLLDLAFLRENIGTVLVLLLLVAGAKTAFNATVLKFLGQSWPKAFLAGALLAQVGEFSFLLAAIGRSGGTIDDYNHNLVVSVTVLSLALSPFWLLSARRLHRIALLGVTSIRETIRILYGSETRQVADLLMPLWAFVSRQQQRRTATGAATAGQAAPVGDASSEDDADRRAGDASGGPKAPGGA
jgi:CPA2 family monovalent cation:H+ antiporter-2